MREEEREKKKKKRDEEGDEEKKRDGEGDGGKKRERGRDIGRMLVIIAIGAMHTPTTDVCPLLSFLNNCCSFSPLSLSNPSRSLIYVCMYVCMYVCISICLSLSSNFSGFCQFCVINTAELECLFHPKNASLCMALADSYLA